MDNFSALREEFEQKLGQIVDLTALDKVRVDYLGKKGSITALLKGMKDLNNEEKKAFGAEVNKLKGFVAKRIEEKIEELRKAEVEREIALALSVGEIEIKRTGHGYIKGRRFAHHGHIHAEVQNRIRAHAFQAVHV